MPSVSIIIRTKDKADSIEVVLRMIFCQTFRDFEVIVVDSGSTDRTLDIAADIVKARLAGKSVFWVYRAPNNERSGYCNSALSLIVRKYKTDRPLSTVV